MTLVAVQSARKTSRSRRYISRHTNVPSLIWSSAPLCSVPSQFTSLETVSRGEVFRKTFSFKHMKNTTISKKPQVLSLGFNSPDRASFTIVYGRLSSITSEKQSRLFLLFRLPDKHRWRPYRFWVSDRFPMSIWRVSSVRCNTVAQGSARISFQMEKFFNQIKRPNNCRILIAPGGRHCLAIASLVLFFTSVLLVVDFNLANASVFFCCSCFILFPLTTKDAHIVQIHKHQSTNS